MALKKIFFISLILFILSVSAVSAADLNSSYVGESSEGIDDSENLNVWDSEISFAAGTFNDLQAEINNAPAGSVLTLTKDYNATYGTNIKLDKDLIIDGQGHTLDCLNYHEAFCSSSGNITLKNLKIINGKNDFDYKGGAIQISGSAQYTLENCILNNNWADDYGGAIYNGVDKQLTLIDCQFSFNTADDESGGAIYSLGKVVAENCRFEFNAADEFGGAIWSSGNVESINSIFQNNTASPGGGAIYCNGDVTCEASTFIGNTVIALTSKALGGAICCNKIIFSCSRFENNYAELGGAIYCGFGFESGDKNITETFTSFFINNSAKNGGAIYSFYNNDVIKNALFKANTARSANGGAISTCGDLTVDHCRFESNKIQDTPSTGLGGAIYSRSVYVSNSTFTDNYSPDYGGAIKAVVVHVNNNQDKQDFNSFFINNKADDDNGGAILAGSLTDSDEREGMVFWTGELKMKNTVLRNNSAKVRGGAVCCAGYLMGDSDLISYGSSIVEHCLFENNKASGAKFYDSNGGAIFAGDLTLSNSTFKDNMADNCGGAIYVDDSVRINIDQNATESFNSFFINNVADGGSGTVKGGAIVSNNGEIRNTLFFGNYANTRGGAVSTFSLSVIHCLFESNVAEGAISYDAHGGALYGSGMLDVLNCTFKDNYAADQGGAIYASNVCVNSNQNASQPYSSFFINNRAADNDGGAICTVDANNDGSLDVCVKNAVFKNNAAYEDGGAIYCYNADVTHCLFESNMANGAKSAQCEGGAIDCKDGLSVDNCIFRNNYAQDYGGAIYADYLDLKPTGSYFEANTAYDNQGGAIWVNKLREDVKNAYFIGNKAGEGASDDGGAIYINNENWLSFESCCFVNNHCSDEGGVIYLDSSSSKLSLVNNIFLGNSADEGTAVFNCGEYVTVKNNWWGEDFPEFNNVLVEWHGLKSNDDHYDVDPLRLCLKVSSSHTSAYSSNFVDIKLFSALDGRTPKLTGLENFIFSTSNVGKFEGYEYGQNTIKARYVPEELGTHKISVDGLFNPQKNVFVYLYVDADAVGPDGKEQVIQNTDLYFTQFQTMVNNAPDGSVINLNNNFVFSELNDNEGIVINKNLVIDGHGHSFDAKSLSGIFQSSQGTVTLKNIVFKNGNQKSADDGGAIRILGSARYTIYNCTFDSNKALQDGGAIYNEGGNLELSDCTFTNNRVSGATWLNDCDGGAVHSKAPLLINHCDFKNIV